MIAIVDRVIPVCVGRGKTGYAQRGKPRFMFTDDEGRSKLEAFLRPHWKALTEPVAWPEWLQKSLTNILGACDPTTAVMEYDAAGVKLYLVNVDQWMKQCHGTAPDYVKVLERIENEEKSVN